MNSHLSLLILAALLSSSLLPRSSSQQDTLSQTETLTSTQALISAGGTFKLGFFTSSPTDLQYHLGIWYHSIPLQTVVWVANREKPLPTTGGALTLTSEGNLVLTDRDGKMYWSTNTTVEGKAYVKLQDCGNLVVVDEAGLARWQSCDHLTDTLLPGMKLGVNLRSGERHRLTSWKNEHDPAPGDFTAELDTHGDPQVYLLWNNSRVWRSGPWNGLRFSGVPEMQSYSSYFSINYSANDHEVSYSFTSADPSVLSRLVVHPSGQIRRLVWVPAARSWTTFWFAPRDQCDPFAHCGPYGLCDADKSPTCDCVRGFHPKSPRDWYLRDGMDGCERTTPLDCQNGTDGFLRVAGAKLPDTSRTQVILNMSLETCQRECLRHCKCTAFAAADVSGRNSGCIMWDNELTDLRVYSNGGQDLFVKLARGELGSISQDGSKVWIIATIVSTFLVIIVGCIISVYLVRRQQNRGGILHTVGLCEQQYVESHAGKDLELPLYDFATMMAATSNFSHNNKIGEGGFGPVYKGRIIDGEQEVAIKRLSKSSFQGAEEFKNEVMLIAKLQHRNLVRLLGCCVEREERMLVYEHVPNKSLDSFLFDKEKGALLDWKSRYQIITGIARGLLYLHEDSRLRIIHRDLKASNVLLDEQMNPKISDFGLARIFGGDETEVNTKKVVGTYGYMSPEYAMDGVFSVKSDVFSFGVLVLEIISGKKNRGFYYLDPTQNLLGHVWSLWVEGNSLEIVDKSIGYVFPTSEVLKCMKIGLLCVQESPEDRPTMSSVILMLGSDNASLPSPKRPGFVRAAGEGPVVLSSSGRQMEGCSINTVTVTAIEGR